MRKYLLSSVPILLAVSPVLMAVLWHITNRGWPNSDEAQYMRTAYEQYLVFRDVSIPDGVKGLYQIRGWRPVLLPVMATPFLLLFNGNILAAVSMPLIICFFVCQVYLYKISRLYLEPLRAALVAAFVGLCPFIIFSSCYFAAQIPWLAFYTGFIFHLLKSEYFRISNQSLISGVFLGLSTLIRPAETIATTVIPLFVIIVIAWRRKIFSFSNTAIIIGFSFLNGFLLLSSALEEPIDYKLVIGLGIIFLVSQFFIIEENKRNLEEISGFNLFALSFTFINLLWWADSMPKLLSWIYEASFGTMAHVTDAARNEGFFSFLKNIFTIYLIPQGILAGLLCLIFLSPDARKKAGDMKGVGILSIITLGMLLPMMLLYALTGTSDERRLFTGMSFLLLLMSILSLQKGPLRKVRETIIVVMIVAQLAGLFAVVKGSPFLVRYFQHVMPQTREDQNMNVIFRLRQLGVPPKSPVAIYTQALFQKRDRIYDPASLALAALASESRFEIIYFWDVGDYTTILRRMRETGIPFLLIDVYEDPENQNRHQPPAQFTSALQKFMKYPLIDPPGLQRVASFTIDGREQVLFKVSHF